MKRRIKWWGWMFISTGILVLLAFLALMQPWTFLPHGSAQISLPFRPEDDKYTNMIPMGEIEQWHNASTGLPDGHPGIDFQWNKETKILAVADGRITKISKNEYGIYIVEQQIGLFYRTVYQELNKIEPNIRFFSKVKKGQLLGYSGNYRAEVSGPPKESDPSRQIHWDFSTSSMAVFRLCPLNHFDVESRSRIEAIWARVKASGEYKQEYPNICNGAYKV